MVSLDVVDVGAVLLVQQLVHDRLKAHGHEHRLLAVDGDPLELVLRHQVLERQLQVVGRLAAALRRRVGGDFLVIVNGGDPPAADPRHLELGLLNLLAVVGQQV